jgi:hypothetical protein
LSHGTPDLLELSRYWQRQLRLEDWDLQLHVNVRPEMLDGATGQCRTNLVLRAAKIFIADPSLLDLEDLEVMRDVEVTLVHELLHVALADVKDHSAGEPAIERIARALVFLHRGIRR